MRFVFLLINPENIVIAIYDNEEMALKVKKPLEEKFTTTLKIEKRSVNQSLETIGVYK